MELTDALIALSASPQITSREICRWLKVNKGAKDFSCHAKKLKFPPGKKDTFSSHLNEEESKQIITTCRRAGVKIVPFFSPDYPRLLQEIPDFPVILYCRGNLGLFSDKYPLAVVGARRATPYGLSYSRKVARRLAEVGATIVSGLALGIDAEAHRGALEASSKTIAVLGTAIDEIYPSVHINLAAEIIKKDGLIISEYPPGYPTFRVNFPFRNRIIAGLSRAVLVTEAAEKSGALITARLAADYNREVFALPADPEKISHRGTNQLIQSGAHCALSADDILKVLGLGKASPKRKTNLDKEGQAVLEAISSGEESFDKIATATRMDVAQLNGILLQLEIKGLIKNVAGEYFSC